MEFVFASNSVHNNTAFQRSFTVDAERTRSRSAQAMINPSMQKRGCHFDQCRHDDVV
uniref:Uncharacterized protein n=1 Tax=Globisporangium ultimum (strain ATCC 200006 / CBS 805.95 / DAOM BR144) TaxID=431595 RepID=K3WWG6_GLOUD